MRLYSTIIDGKGERHSVADMVSRETLRVHNAAEDDRLCTLFLRERDRKAIAGELFVFQIPPQSLSISRDTAISVQGTRHGYVVNEGGLRQPTFTLQGHFGWRLRRVRLPEPVKAILHLKGKGDQYADNNFWLPLPWLASPDAEGLIENATDADGGVSSVEAFTQTYDGRTAFFALCDIIIYYHEQNQRRVAQGKPPMEMVFIEPQHSLRWVVSPKYPDLKRTVDTQGTYPYTLELVGVYDDSRRRASYGEAFAWAPAEGEATPVGAVTPKTGAVTLTPPPTAPPNPTFLGPELPPGSQLSPGSAPALLLPLPIPGASLVPGASTPFIGPRQPVGSPANPLLLPFIGPRRQTLGPNLPSFLGPELPVFVGPQVPPYLPVVEAGPIEPIGGAQ